MTTNHWIALGFGLTYLAAMLIIVAMRVYQRGYKAGFDRHAQIMGLSSSNPNPGAKS